eukprot:374082_1
MKHGATDRMEAENVAAIIYPVIVSARDEDLTTRQPACAECTLAITCRTLARMVLLLALPMCILLLSLITFGITPQFEPHSVSNPTNESHLHHNHTFIDPTDLFTTFDLNITDYLGTWQSKEQIFSESRVVTGNLAHFWRFFHKILIKKECVTTLIVGGSV